MATATQETPGTEQLRYPPVTGNSPCYARANEIWPDAAIATRLLDYVDPLNYVVALTANNSIFIIQNKLAYVSTQVDPCDLFIIGAPPPAASPTRSEASTSMKFIDVKGVVLLDLGPPSACRSS